MEKIKSVYRVGVAVFGGLLLALPVTAQTRFNELEDAAAAQAKIWQAGGKAKPLLSSDGKVIFAYGQSMPKLTCSPQRACDVEMEPGEKVKKVILGDGVNWQWDAAESIERGKVVQHVIIQPKDKDVETNAIITTDRRTYHIKLFSPRVEGAYINRMGFYYPSELVASWSDKMAAVEAAEQKEQNLNVMATAVAPGQLAFDYRIDGDAEFKPMRVFNNGEQVFMAMPDVLRNGENPAFVLINEEGKEMVVNYRRDVDPNTGAIHYVVDKLFAKGELRRGKETVKISWQRKEKRFWQGYQ